MVDRTGMRRVHLVDAFFWVMVLFLVWLPWPYLVEIYFNGSRPTGLLIAVLGFGALVFFRLRLVRSVVKDCTRRSPEFLEEDRKFSWPKRIAVACVGSALGVFTPVVWDDVWPIFLPFP